MPQVGNPIVVYPGVATSVPLYQSGPTPCAVLLSNASSFALQVQSGGDLVWIEPSTARAVAWPPGAQVGPSMVPSVPAGVTTTSGTVLPTYYYPNEDVPGWGSIGPTSAQPPESVGILTLDAGTTSVQLTALVQSAWTGVVVDVNPASGQAISFVADATCSGVGTGTATVVMPASALPWDTAIAFVADSVAGSASAPGWTNVGVSASETVQIFVRTVLVGDPGTTFTFYVQNTGASQATVDLAVYRNVTGIGPFAATEASFTAPSVVAAAAGDFVVCAWTTL